MALSDTDLLLIQRDTTPYKVTAVDFAGYSNTKIELGDGKDVPIASASQLGVIKVGANLEITGDGTLSAVIPAGLTYKGTWTDADNPPSPAENGDFYIWDAADATLNNALWGSINGETVTEGDRLFYDGSTWTIISGGGGGGLTQITGTSPIVVTAVNAGEQDVSILASSSAQDGYMSKEDKAKLDGISPGAQVNVDPSQIYTTAADSGSLTLTPGGDVTVIPIATDAAAGLMSAADKAIIEDLVANPGGVLSLVAGKGIDINTSAPGSAGTPEVNVKFYAPEGVPDATTLVMPANLQMLGDLP